MSAPRSFRAGGEDPETEDQPLVTITSALAEAEGDVTEAARIIIDSPAEDLADDRIDRERERLAIVGRWRYPLDGLDLLVAYADEAGGLWNDRYGEAAFSEPAYRARALHQLWGLSVTVGAEVRVLLSAGLGLGAFARWRTLYEAQVLSRVISLAGEETALRFLDREALRNASATLRWHIGAKRDRRLERLDRAITKDAQAAVDQVLVDNGQTIHGDYGWAHHFLLDHSNAYRSRAEAGTPAPRFSDLQTIAGLGDHDPEYADASLAVHASPVYGARHLPPEVRGTFSGASTYGLDRAGALACEAIIDVLAGLLRCYPDPPDPLLADTASVLEEAADFVAGEFQEVGELVDREAAPDPTATTDPASAP